MHIQPMDIPDVLLITPHRHADERGFFSEVFQRAALQKVGVVDEWIQDNQAYSAQAGVLRGLHWQAPPFAQAKLVRVLRGAVFDVAVDLRRRSPSFGRHVALELSAQNWRQLYVPSGFAHGYCTLQPDTEVLYKVSAPYAPAHEGGLLWCDPTLAIPWPMQPTQLSARDRRWPTLSELETPFR